MRICRHASTGWRQPQESIPLEPLGEAAARIAGDLWNVIRDALPTFVPQDQREHTRYGPLQRTLIVELH